MTRLGEAIVSVLTVLGLAACMAVLAWALATPTGVLP
jgi:hypothetical protein